MRSPLLSAHSKNFSTTRSNGTNKVVDTTYIILLTYPMFVAPRRSFFTSLPRYFASVPSSSILSYSPLEVNPFRMRTSTRNTYNPFRIRTFKTQDLNSFRMCSYEKTGRGEGPLTSPNSPRSSANFASLRYPFSFFTPLLTTHYSLLTIQSLLFLTHFPILLPHHSVSAIFSPEEGERQCQLTKSCS
jgi:hypothetical protein